MKLYHGILDKDVYTTRCFCGKLCITREKLFRHIGYNRAKLKNIIELAFIPITTKEDKNFFYQVKCLNCGKIYRANQYIYQYRHYLKHKRGLK